MKNLPEASDFEAIPQPQLLSLGELAKEQHVLLQQIAILELQLKTANDRLSLILEKLMPDIMVEIGMEQMKLLTGEKLTLKTFYNASIKDEFKEAAFKWLRENNHDAIIKNKIEGSFGKGEDALVKEVAETLEKLAPGVFTRKESVHPQTLKSFVKEQLEAGAALPQETFGVFVGKKVTIK